MCKGLRVTFRTVWLATARLSVRARRHYGGSASHGTWRVAKSILPASFALSLLSALLPFSFSSTGERFLRCHLALISTMSWRQTLVALVHVAMIFLTFYTT